MDRNEKSGPKPEIENEETNAKTRKKKTQNKLDLKNLKEKKKIPDCMLSVFFQRYHDVMFPNGFLKLIFLHHWEQFKLIFLNPTPASFVCGFKLNMYLM